MRLEQEAGHQARLDFLRVHLGEAELRMRPDIGVGPTVEPVFRYLGEKVGNEPVAEASSLLHDRVEIAGVRMERERSWVAQARRERRLVRSVGVEALDRCLDLG